MARVLAGKYQLEQVLGRGGMGEVYRAANTATGRAVAVKLLRAEAVAEATEDTGDLVARFRREARALGAIQSAHIVQVLDAGEDAVTKEPFMVMELLDGEDLTSLLKRLGPMPVELAVRLAAQAALGLSQAHKLGIVHRDIKPANLFLNRDEHGTYTVKILDFGIARVKPLRGDGSPGDGPTRDMTRTGSMLGTPQYMAPEQVRGLKTIDARADVWSLGIVLYRLLTGRTPHDQGEGGVGEMLLTICIVPAKPIQDIAPWVPPEVAEIVHRALRIAPSERYEDAGALFAALAALCSAGSTAVREDMLRALPPETRAYTAQRAPSADAVSATDRMSREPAMTGAGVSADPETRIEAVMPPPRRRPPTRPGVMFAVGALGMVAALGVGVPVYRAVHSTPVAVAPPPPPPSATIAPPVAPIVHHVALVVPPNAMVTVDDDPEIRAGDGTVLLNGTLGSTHRVRATLGGVEATALVAISETGPVPARLDIAPPPKPAASPPPVSPGPRPGHAIPTPSTSSPMSAKPPPKPSTPGTELVTSFE